MHAMTDVWVISFHYLMMKERKWSSGHNAQRILDMAHMFVWIEFFIVGWRDTGPHQALNTKTVEKKTKTQQT